MTGASNAAVARRADIIAEAATLFDKVGYHKASMSDLAEEVGTSKANLYHYFSSKDEILYWIHEEFINLLIDHHEQRLRTRMSNPQLLLEVMSDILELMETHRGHVRVFFEHHRELPPEQREAMQRKRDRYLSDVHAVVVAGVERGEFTTNDTMLTTLAIFGMCNWAYQWFRREGPQRPRELAYYFWEFIMLGMATPSERARLGDAPLTQSD